MTTAQKPRLLYIEDDDTLRRVVKRTLENRSNYEVLEAADGVTGIARAQQELPDIILVDINIPGMDGYEVAIRLKSLDALRNTPIVAVTGQSEEGIREQALAAGCDGFIEKPLDMRNLPRQLQQFMAGKREVVDPDKEVQYLRQHTQRIVQRLESKATELAHTNRELREADRLKSKFISLAAHELRTPLTIVKGYLGIVFDARSDGRSLDAQELLLVINGIDQGVRRLNSIVNDIVDITRIEAGTLELTPSAVTLSEMIQSVGRDVALLLQQRNQKLIIGPVKRLPKIWGDSQRLYQVFTNLVGNAIKYTPDGGQIEITGVLLHTEQLPPKARVKDKGLSVDYVDVVIKDTGIGIAEQDQERIFDRFYEVRDDALHSTSKHEFRGGGVGLGLAIARGVVEAHGGWIWVESAGCDLQQCPGSCFHVLLPVRPLGHSPAARQSN